MDLPAVAVTSTSGPVDAEVQINGAVSGKVTVTTPSGSATSAVPFVVALRDPTVPVGPLQNAESGVLSVQAACVRARCERIDVERCRSTFDENGESGSTMRVLSS